jgi:outer membrane protein assembly factor BamB
MGANVNLARRVLWPDRGRGMRLWDAAVGALVLVAVILGWRAYASWCTGRVELTTRGEAVLVQVLEEASDKPMGEAMGLVDRAVLELPAGEYRLRVDGRGRLGRTFRFSVHRGETQSYAISIDEGRLLGGEPVAEEGDGKKQLRMPIPYPAVAGALELDPSAGMADLIEWTEKSLIRRDGATGRVIWEVVSPVGLVTSGNDSGSFMWNTSQVMTARSSFVQPAPDLDGDGIGDILLNLRRDVTFAAFSGKDGASLWIYAADSDGKPRPRVRDPFSSSFRSLLEENFTAGEPAMADFDRDGAPDLIATWILSDSSDKQKRMLVAISGRSGIRLWTYPIDETPIHVPASNLERGAVLVKGRESRLVVYVDGSEWIGLDPATGKRRIEPIDLGFDPVVPVQHADLDGDGEPEILALGQVPGGKERLLRAFSIKNGREIWSHSVDAAADPLLKGDLSRGVPALMDVDGDGRPEILVRDAGPMPPLPGERGVRLIEGATGAPRWRIAMSAATKDVSDRVAEAIAAPDLDGDGVREIITVSEYEIGKAAAIYADALSGKDGRRVWSWNVSVESGSTGIWRPIWWGHGSDGWPLLALPLGGEAPGEVREPLADGATAEPIVHLLEASTGREQHRVIGLANAASADFDGDGLDDLWGEVDGELRAFRGEAPEAWRALGRLDRAGWPLGTMPAFSGLLGAFGIRDLAETFVDPLWNRRVDFDSDGVGDVLIGELKAPGAAKHEWAGSHIAIARSGRDGHVIWKTEIDPRGNWFSPTGGETYSLNALSLPGGDLDGDGTADVIVNRSSGIGSVATGAGRALEMELLSGRTGARKWSGGISPAGLLGKGDMSVIWTEACVVEPQGRPDVIVGVARPFFGRSGLARVSGRDGRVLWEVELDQMGSSVIDRPHFFGDLDGDGGLDVLVLFPSMNFVQGDCAAVAISLRDGKRLWSETLSHQSPCSVWRQICVADLDGDGRAEVVVVDEFSEARTPATGIRVLDGRDGKVRWTWKLEVGLFPPLAESRDVALGNFDGDGKRCVCVSVWQMDETCETFVLDPSGKERARLRLGARNESESIAGLAESLARRLASATRGELAEESRKLTAADLDGDGRDELLVYQGGRLHALDRDLKERWFWPTRFSRIDQVIAGGSGRAGTVIMPPGVVLDGAAGVPRWIGQSPVGESTAQHLMPKVLDPGDSKTAPLLISNGPGITVCRVAMATTADWSFAPAHGKVAARGQYRSDPRWARRLPWLARMRGALGPTGFLVSGCLAFVNVFLPLLILWLVAGRRRSFKMWVLMVLPAVAVVPLLVYQTATPWLTAGEGRLLRTETRVFLTGTLAGIPIVYYLVVIGGNLVRRRWRALAVLLGLTLGTAVVVSVAWVMIDRRRMATGFQHYDLEGWRWLWVLFPGAYGAAVLSMVGKGARPIFRAMGRRNKGRRGEAERAEVQPRAESTGKREEILHGGQEVQEKI